mgnify:CR=1 FL=1
MLVWVFPINPLSLSPSWTIWDCTLTTTRPTGVYPLHLATEKQNYRLVRLLIDFGGNETINEKHPRYSAFL